MTPYSLNNKREMSPNDNRTSGLSVAGVMKPLSIGSLTSITSQTKYTISEKIKRQLFRVNKLQIKIRNQMLNPKYEAVKRKNEIDLKAVQSAYNVHYEYFSKVMKWKSQGVFKNQLRLKLLQEQYRKKLFLLNQSYQRECLQLKNVEIPNTTPNNNP